MLSQLPVAFDHLAKARRIKSSLELFFENAEHVLVEVFFQLFLIQWLHVATPSASVIFRSVLHGSIRQLGNEVISELADAHARVQQVEEIADAEARLPTRQQQDISRTV